MSGILEQIHAQNGQILAMLQGLQQQIGSQQPAYAPQPVQYAPQPQPMSTNTMQFAPQNLEQPAPPAGAVQNVSGDQLQALIMPHIDNVAIKEALGAAMRAAGVNALPEAQPHQYGDLYARFQAVLAAHGVGAGGPVAAAPAPSASII